MVGVLFFMDDDLNQDIRKFLTNDWPHAMNRIGRLEGIGYVIVPLLVAVVSLLGALVAIVAK